MKLLHSSQSLAGFLPRRLLAMACVAGAILLASSGSPAQNALESELRALQMKQQQELLDMQKKIATQQAAKPGDPSFCKTKSMSWKPSSEPTNSPSMR